MAFIGAMIKNIVLGLRVFLKMEFVKIRWHEDPNATHRDYLVWVLRALKEKGPITTLEIGCGLFSTLTIGRELDNQSDKFYSFENNLQWFDKVQAAIVESNLECKLRSVDSYKEALVDFLPQLEGPIDLAFIDSSPWESRVEALELLRFAARVVVIHDVDYFPHNGIFGLEEKPIKHPLLHLNLSPYFNRSRLGRRTYDDIFRYWVEIFPEIPSGPTGPPTLVGSNLIDIREFFREIVMPGKGIFLFSEN